MVWHLSIIDSLDSSKSFDYRIIGYCGIYRLTDLLDTAELSIKDALDTANLLITYSLDNAESIDYRLIRHCRIYGLQIYWILRSSRLQTCWIL